MKTKSIFVFSFLFCFILTLNNTYSQFKKKYNSLPDAKSILGNVVFPEDGNGTECAKGGKFQRYEHGNIYWHPDVGAYEIHGAILDKYGDLNWEQGFLGFPRSDELWTPDHSGRFQLFQGGNIYWRADLGAHFVVGKILGKYGEYKFEQGFLGYPVTDEVDPGDGRGRFQNFEGGQIYWTPKTGAHEVHGAIFDKWGDYNWEKGFLGYPVTDEVDPGDGRGRFQNFEGGQIYWTPETGAHEVHGAIFDKWGESNWEKGPLGYPLTGIMEVPGTKKLYCEFEHGKIEWDPAAAAKVKMN